MAPRRVLQRSHLVPRRLYGMTPTTSGTVQVMSDAWFRHLYDLKTGWQELNIIIRLSTQGFVDLDQLMKSRNRTNNDDERPWDHQMPISSRAA